VGRVAYGTPYLTVDRGTVGKESTGGAPQSKNLGEEPLGLRAKGTWNDWSHNKESFLFFQGGTEGGEK